MDLKKLNEKQRRESYIEKNYPDEYVKIIKFNFDNKIEGTFSKKLYHYYNNLDKEKSCKICKNEVNFINFNKGYRDYCSKKCSMSDKYIVEKRNEKSKKTSVEKYGYDNPMKCDIIKRRVIETNIKKYGVDYISKLDSTKDKIKNTNLKKWGVSCTLQNEEVKKKTLETNIKKYGVDHHMKNKNIKETIKNKNIEKHGVGCIFELKEIKEKSLSTNLKKYGVDHHMKFKMLKGTSKFSYEESMKYFLNKTPKNYELKSIEEDNLNMYHKDCSSNFIISKQLFYLRNKDNRILCTKCNSTKSKSISYDEKELLDFIRENYDKEIIENSKSIIKPYELDIYLPEINLAMEYNGLYWHSELYKDKYYHQNKTILCAEKNIKLIQIWEDDWKRKKERIKKYILNILNTYNIEMKNYKVLEMKNYKKIKNFVEENSLSDFTKGEINLGLFKNNELISVLIMDINFNIINICDKYHIKDSLKYFIDYILEKFRTKKISIDIDLNYSFGSEFLKYGFVGKIKEPNLYYFINKERKENPCDNSIKIYDSGIINYTLIK